MHRNAGLHARIVAAQFRSEIDAFLQIGLARREFAADRKETAPRTAAARHRDLLLLVERQREEGARGRVKPRNRCGRDAVAGNVEEAGVAAGAGDLARDIRLLARIREKRADVDHGKFARGFHSSSGRRGGSG